MKFVSENVSHLENPLLEEDTYNGRMFHLNLPKTGHLNCGYLKEELEDRRITLNDNSLGLDEKENLYIPDVFESGFEDEGRVASIPRVKEFHQGNICGIIGHLAHHEPNTVRFDGKEILTLDQQSTKFLIFEFNGQAFLLILASRNNIGTLHRLLMDTLQDLGFVVDEISIDHSEFEEIADVLIDTHLMTAVEDYEETSIHKKHIVGRGYGNAEEYKREKRQGAVHGHRFGTSQLDADSKTIQISQDCLIRSYHKLTLSMYLSMITSYIIPSLSLTIQTSVSGYGSEGSRVTTDQVTED